MELPAFIDIGLIMMLLGGLTIPTCLMASIARVRQGVFFLRAARRQNSPIYRLAACDYFSAAFLKLVLADIGLGLLLGYPRWAWALHLAAMLVAVAWSRTTGRHFHLYLKGEG